jgi:Domain of unknown function (DUF1905)
MVPWEIHGPSTNLRAHETPDALIAHARAVLGFMLNKSFSAKLEKSPNKGGWTYVVWPGSVKFFGTKGLVKISGTIDGHPFRGSFMAMGDGRHMLPVKAEIRKVIGKDVGQTVKVLLEERL